jgi:uroporphyrinogen decarboxylase
MTARERVFAAVHDAPVDRVPFTLWRHFYPDEAEARSLADVTVAFTRRHRFDLVKFNSRADYHAEPWGTTYEYAGSADPRLVGFAVTRTEEWARIDRRGLDEPAFRDLLEGLRLVRRELPDIPLVATIFTPLGVLGRLAAPAQLLADLREDPDAVAPALEAVTETFRDVAAACSEIADGIFLATTAVAWWPTAWGTAAASQPHLVATEYARFGTPWDLRVLEGAAGAPLNILHVCGEDAPVIELGERYPVAAVSWSVHGRGHPSLDAFLAKVVGKGAVGGISNPAFGDPERGKQDAGDGLARTGGRRWIAAGDCTIPVTSDATAIDAAGAALGGG